MALVQHDQTVAVGDGIAHIVGNHQSGQVMLADDPVGEFQHLGGGFGVQGGGMLVQEQQFGPLEGGHQQRNRLPLAAGEQTHLGGQPVFQAQLQIRQDLPVLFPLGLPDTPHQTALGAPPGSDGQIFCDFHIRGGALHGVLEHPAQISCPLVLRHIGHVHTVNFDGTPVRLPHTGNGVEQGGFSRAVAADDGDEVPVRQAQVQPVQGHFCVDRTGIEGFMQIGNFKHVVSLPALSFPCADTRSGCRGCPGTAPQ